MNRTDHAPDASRSASVSGVAARFLGVGAVFFAAFAALGGWLTGGVTTAGVQVAAGFYVLALGMAVRALRGYPHDSVGLCNVVTLFRLVLVCGLIAMLVTPAAGPWAVFAVATGALVLDGVDGWLARRGDHVSDFGAAFDMEVDAVLALVLALYAYSSGQAGAIILLLGVPRYLFWVAQFPVPWLSGPLPARFSRKLVCVVQIGVLIAVLVPGIGPPLSDVLAGGAAAALLWSFGRDIIWLRRARA
jgi:phosphatidylglycerophosphate synthase